MWWRFSRRGGVQAHEYQPECVVACCERTVRTIHIETIKPFFADEPAVLVQAKCRLVGHFRLQDNLTCTSVYHFIDCLADQSFGCMSLGLRTNTMTTTMWLHTQHGDIAAPQPRAAQVPVQFAHNDTDGFFFTIF